MSIKYWILFFSFSLLPFFSLAQSKGAVYTFSITQSSITDALRQVEKETGTNIAFSPRFFNPTQKQDFQFKQKTISEILDVVLEDQMVKYSVISGQIVISRLIKPTFSLYGYLTDGQSGERLLYANIWCPKLSIGTTTNEHGYFSLTLPEGKYMLELSHTGFQTEKLELDFTKNTRLNIQLNPIITLAEVVVTPEKQILKSIPPGGLSGLQMRTDDYAANPDFGGETDVLRACSLLPGIHSGDNGMGGLHVRGGDTDQNLVLLDGVPVYNSGHIFHLFSIFNNEIVQNTRVLKGGFPSRYGGCISSVMDVRTRDGNLNKWHATAGLGLMSANATVEGPLKKGESSILLSTRRTHLDYLLQPYTLGTCSRLLNGSSFQDTSGLTANSQFFDINTKIRLKLGTNDQLFTSFLFW
ncbi:MAG: carboxypeptidase-like regulatory domain-containing protein [Saprospiraceae bacterium]